MQNITNKIKLELEKAIMFSENGEHGKSRVCARKAAGLAFQNWLLLKVANQISLNPYEALVYAYGLQAVPNDVKVALEQLTKKVDENYQLPEEFDLIESAKKVIVFCGTGSDDE